MIRNGSYRNIKGNKMAKNKSNTAVVETVVEQAPIPTNEQGLKTVVVLTTEEQATYDGLSTKSAKIRYLTALNYTRSSIAKFMGIVYQHVREVQLRPLKKGPRT